MYSRFRNLTVPVLLVASGVLYLLSNNALYSLTPLGLAFASHAILFRAVNKAKQQVSQERQRLESLLNKKSQLESLQIEKTIEQIPEYQKLVREIERIEESLKDVEEIEAECNRVKQQIHEKEIQLEPLEKHVENYLKAKGVLAQEGLSAEDAATLLEKLWTEKKSLETAVNDVENKLTNLLSRKQLLSYDEEVYRSTVQRLEEARETKNNLDNKITELRTTIAHLQEECRRLESELAALMQDRRKLERLETRLAVLEKIRQVFHKDGPLQKIVRKQAASAFETAAKAFLQEFGLHFTDIEIDEEFNVSVHGRYGRQSLETLSGGEKIVVALVLKLAIASSLAGQTLESIIMDEPTIHLDPERRRELVEVLKNFRGGGRLIPQIIVVSHDRELEEAADQVYEVVLTDKGSVIRTEQQPSTET